MTMEPLCPQQPETFFYKPSCLQRGQDLKLPTYPQASCSHLPTTSPPLPPRLTMGFLNSLGLMQRTKKGWQAPSVRISSSSDRLNWLLSVGERFLVSAPYGRGQTDSDGRGHGFPLPVSSSCSGGRKGPGKATKVRAWVCGRMEHGPQTPTPGSSLGPPMVTLCAHPQAGRLWTSSHASLSPLLSLYK